MEQIHIVKAEYAGAKVTMRKTQLELSELLKDPAFHLISVNAQAPTYQKKPKKKGRNPV